PEAAALSELLEFHALDLEFHGALAHERVAADVAGVVQRRVEFRPSRNNSDAAGEESDRGPGLHLGLRQSQLSGQVGGKLEAKSVMRVLELGAVGVRDLENA